MEFRIAELVRYPLHHVYTTYRDHLCDLVPYLPNVDVIEAVEREQLPQGMRQLNRWKVNAAIPRVVRPFFSEKMMTYLDRAQWIDADSRVDWRFEIGVFPEAVDCHGANTFRVGPSPETTEVALTGTLAIDLGKVRGVPRFLHGLASRVEGFILNQVRPNLVSVCRAVGSYLQDHPI